MLSMGNLCHFEKQNRKINRSTQEGLRSLNSRTKQNGQNHDTGKQCFARPSSPRVAHFVEPEREPEREPKPEPATATTGSITLHDWKLAFASSVHAACGH